MMEFCVFFVIPFDENTPRGAGDAVIEIVMRTASIIDDAYADIMKGIWS